MSSEHPILFSAPMIRAILAGHKTQTRRVARVDPSWQLGSLDRGFAVFYDPDKPRRGAELRCPYGVPGDRLWVRETWYDDLSPEPPPEERERHEDGTVEGIDYRATHDCRNYEAGCPCNPDGDGKRSEWRTPIYMPRWASRITLEITRIRLEKLQKISEEDARAEGVPSACMFRELWESINRRRAPWATNPWVWVPSFRVVTKEEEANHHVTSTQ